MTKILIVSHEIQLSRMLNCTLTYYGFQVEVAMTYQEAWLNLQQIHFDLVLLDLAFQDGKGLQFCEELNECDLGASLIVMGEYPDEANLIEGMKTMLDDYILKPFGMQELKMLINKHLERRELRIRPIILGDLEIDAAKNVILAKDKILTLGKKEMEIILLMTRKAGRIITPDRLITEKRIKSLSKKLKKTIGEALQIKSISGLGYQLVIQN